jgi:hypothetical protein
MTTAARLCLVAALAIGGTAVLGADTLYLRNGTQLRGELVAVRDNIIEFAEDRTAGGARVRQFDREDVLRIEFESRYTTGRGRGTIGRPAGMRERTVVVTANVPWSDSGIDVRAGQEIYLAATGIIRWGPGDRRDGPDGERSSPVNAGRPMPNRAAGALIGKVGAESGDLFFLGSQEGPIRMRSSGRLFLGINDDVLTDNQGNFRVLVYY